MKFIITSIAYLFFIGCAIAQQKDNLTRIKNSYYIYSSFGKTNNTIESVKTNSTIPNSIVTPQKDIDSCLAGFKRSLVANLDYHTSNVIINGQKEPSTYQIKIISRMNDCPNINEIICKGNWIYVKNEKNENILTADSKTIDKENDFPVQFKKFVYTIPLNYKEGDSKPVKVGGNIVLTIPTKFKMIELTANDINKEIQLNNITFKLLEIKNGIYKIEMSERTPSIKILPVSSKNLEFSSIMTTTLPLFYYKEFSKKESLTDEELASIQLAADKTDKRVVLFGSASGSINKIYLYTVESFSTQEIEIDLELK